MSVLKIYNDQTGQWEEAVVGKQGIKGDKAWLYIAYADDENGTGFTLTFDPLKTHIALLKTYTEIPSPTVSDFDGLWKKYEGDFSNKENVNDLGEVSGSITVDLSKGTIIKATLTGAITDINFVNLPSPNTEYSISFDFTNVESIVYPTGTLFVEKVPQPSGSRYRISCSIDSTGTLIVYGVLDNILEIV